jgi:transcription elongation factor Elf1
MSNEPKTVTRRSWIAAAKQLSADPGARVTCPECGNATLEVTDQAWPDGSHLDRYLQCPACGASNVVTLVLEENPAPEDESAPGGQRRGQ